MVTPCSPHPCLAPCHVPPPCTPRLSCCLCNPPSATHQCCRGVTASLPACHQLAQASDPPQLSAGPVLQGRSDRVPPGAAVHGRNAAAWGAEHLGRAVAPLPQRAGHLQLSRPCAGQLLLGMQSESTCSAASGAEALACMACLVGTLQHTAPFRLASGAPAWSD